MPKERTEDEKILVIGMLQLTDALEHAMRALFLAPAPEDPVDRVKHGKHLMLMTAGVQQAKETCGELLADEARRLADEEAAGNGSP